MKSWLSCRATLLVVAAVFCVASCGGGGEESEDVKSPPDTTKDVPSGCLADKECESDNPCLTPVCNNGKCGTVANDLACDDGDPCTEGDQCAEGKCAGEAKDCDDGEYCNGKETCDSASGECVGGQPPVVDDGIECTADLCDEEKKAVVHSPNHTSCDDSNPCTEDKCSMQEDCTNEPADQACSDGDVCTEGDWCVDGECVPGEGACFEDCTNEEDDDNDDLVDCEDPDCELAPECAPETEVDCGNEIDDDLDELVDCLDPDCEESPDCGPDEETNCTNKIDDDLDEQTDCEDSDCEGHPACADYPGEGCDDALDVNDGQPLSAADAGSVFTYEGDTTYMNGDLGGSCADGAASANDTVYRLELAETMAVSLNHDFSGSAWPVVYLLDDGCEDGIELGCASGSGNAAKLELVLDAGTYYAVLDAVYAGDKEEYTFLVAVDLVPGTETDCFDAKDNDLDEAVDCADDDCAASPNCLDPYENNDDADSAYDLGNTPTSTAGANIYPAADADWFAFSLPGPGYLDLAAAPGQELDLVLGLADGSGSLLDQVDAVGAGESETISFTVYESGTFHAAIHGFADSAGDFELAIGFVAVPGNESECLDGNDDDLDGLVDCNDPDCLAAAACGAGDTCLQPLLINDGAPVGPEMEGQILTYEGSTVGYGNELMGSCSSKSGHAPDAVWLISVSETVQVGVSVLFSDDKWPAIYLLQEGCEAELACDATSTSQAGLSLQLSAGEYTLIVDGAWDNAAADYELSVAFEALLTEDDCGDGVDNDLDGLTDCCDDECAGTPGCLVEITCGNGIDDDCDGAADCFDQDCAQASACLGHTCANALMVADAPLGEADSGLEVISSGHTGPKEADYSAWCAAASSGSPDEVWSFELQVPMFVSVEVQNAIVEAPVMFGYVDSCFPWNSEFCDQGQSGALSYLELLDPGVYYFILDSNGEGGYPYEIQWKFIAVSSAEIFCQNGQDDDDDGLSDCFDPDCVAEPACVGETCAVANQVNDGAPIGPGDIGNSFSYQGDTTGMSWDLTGSCSQASQEAADDVWEIVVDELLLFTFSMDFDSKYTAPVLYLMGDQCTAETELACASGGLDPSELVEPLEPGTYYLVADADFVGDEGTYSLTVTPSLYEETNCTDGIDDEKDGLIDCMDDDCLDEEICAGETCTYPSLIGNGEAIGLADAGLQILLQGDTTTKAPDHSGSCANMSVNSNDVVWTFELADTMAVLMSHDFEGTSDWPVLYIYKDGCSAEEEVACGMGDQLAVVLDLVLEPGTYFVVADGETGIDKGPFTLIVEFSEPTP